LFLLMLGLLLLAATAPKSDLYPNYWSQRYRAGDRPV